MYFVCNPHLSCGVKAEQAATSLEHRTSAITDRRSVPVTSSLLPEPEQYVLFVIDLLHEETIVSCTFYL